VREFSQCAAAPPAANQRAHADGASLEELRTCAFGAPEDYAMCVARTLTVAEARHLEELFPRLARGHVQILCGTSVEDGLAALPGLTRWLNVSHGKRTDFGGLDGALCAAAGTLERLDFTRSILNSASGAWLDALLRSSTVLESVRLDDCSVFDDGLDALCVGLRRADTRLRELVLTSNRHRVVGTPEHAAALGACESLRSLNLSGCMLSNEFLAQLGRTLGGNTTKLTKLRVCALAAGTVGVPGGASAWQRRPRHHAHRRSKASASSPEGVAKPPHGCAGVP
jgi:hypothetical protein